MTRLYSTINKDFLVAVQTAPGLTVDVQITNPDQTAGALLNLTDPENDGLYTDTFTPSVVGEYWLQIVSPGNDVDGLGIILEVTASGVIYAGGFAAGATDCFNEQGQLVRWPCPKLASLQCINLYTLEQILDWTHTATSTLFSDTAVRFPGCHLFAKLRPFPTASCLVMTNRGRGVDLLPELGYPVIELVDVSIDGVSDDLANWSIERHRYLVPAAGVAWPRQNEWADDGDAGTWSVTVRYGRMPPALLVKARDRFMYSMLLDSEPTTGNSEACTLPDGTTQLVENGRTITINHQGPSSILVDEVKKRWGPKIGDFSGIIDPAERTASNSRYMLRVPGDHMPPEVLAFLQSGCDLEGDLAALQS